VEAILISASFVVTPVAGAPAEDQPCSPAPGNISAAMHHCAPTGSLPGLVRASVPLLIFNAEYDPAYFRRETARLASALQPGGGPRTRFIVLSGHNHMSQILAINTNDRALTSEIERFVRSTR